MKEFISYRLEACNFMRHYLYICPLEFRIDGTLRLLIIPFFVTLSNFIQHSPFINFEEFCQPPLLFQIPRFLIHVHSRQR